jgi:uncharacterized protein (DUF1501 family)
MIAKRISRRQFLVGCSAAIASMAGARLTRLAFASQADAPLTQASINDEILVVVFLRGGWDALNVIPPIAGDDRGYYEAARAYLKVPASGAGAALPLNDQFGLHPALAGLYSLYQGGKLAVVHACGLTSNTRSHFDAMQFMELGTPDQKNTAQGWLTRHLSSATNLPATILMPALSTGNGQAMSLLGNNETVAMRNPDSFTFEGHWHYKDAQRLALRQMYDGDTWVYQAGLQALNAADLIESAAPGNYSPANGAVYPASTFGDQLQVIAQMVKLEVGLRLATIDLGGWDTHEHQGDGSGGYLNDLLADLGNGLAALYTDLDGAGLANYTSRLTVVVKSEFGRRLKENASHGTDHGHGSAMLVLGGSVNGGQVYGAWPGLRNQDLYDGADLAVTTDYRRVLSEIVMRRLENPNLPYIFPGYVGYTPLGVVQGIDLPLPQMHPVALPVVIG